MASTSSVIKEEMNEDSIENSYKRLCLDLNMDNETVMEAWRSYEHICKHYLLEGDQLHWLAVSLYVSCRKNKYLLKSTNNPISISRLLKSANELKLLIFFDKLHKWMDMENLPDQLRKKIDEIESSFNISSIIFQKYFQIFIKIFGGNEDKLNEFNYSEQRKSMKINPKLNHLYKNTKLSHFHLYQFIWTIYSLSKTIYPPTSNDLIASFHLLLASFLFVYLFIKKSKLDYLIKGNILNECGDDKILILSELNKICSFSNDMLNVIYEEYFQNGLFKKINLNNINLLNEKKCFEMINEMNNEYDEIVLTNCIIDERIFLENKNQLNDLINSFNENRNQKTIQNRTPLTANQHLTFISNNSNLTLTPISQANQLIYLLNLIVQNQTNKPTSNLISLIGQQPFLDDLIQRINEWETLFIKEYHFNNEYFHSDQHISSQSSKYRFDFALKLFYVALENILNIEKNRLKAANQNHQQIIQSFQKLILKNEFLKSLLGLCLLLIFYAHSDEIHDLNWILNIYSLHGYSLIKIIQIFLKSLKEINQSRTFIKYLSSIEEIILSSMIFSNDSPLWNEIQTKGILSYSFISNLHSQQTSNQNLTNIFNQSPNSDHVKRKLFTNELTIVRSRSDPIVDKNGTQLRKLSPYTMVYRKLYDLVLSRLDLICLRLFGSKSHHYEKIIWNLFLFLFENYTKILFRSRNFDQIILSTIFYAVNNNILRINQDNQQLTWFRLIQAYKSMPNSKLKTLRSVFIRSINDEQTISNQQIFNKDPCLTPSKPAGTVHIIDGNLIGDIASFYSEIFIKIDNLEMKINDYFKDNELIDLPIRNKQNNNFNEHISINCGQNLFIDYSNQHLQINSFTNNYLNNKINSNNNENNHSNNILSSSIQAGLNNQVQTTTTRTDDGKFLTTISTIPKINSTNTQINQHFNQNQFLFGQSTNNQAFKRTFQQDSNSLTSLTKKVLQIENDRQSIQQ